MTFSIYAETNNYVGYWTRRNHQKWKQLSNPTVYSTCGRPSSKKINWFSRVEFIHHNRSRSHEHLKQTISDKIKTRATLRLKLLGGEINWCISGFISSLYRCLHFVRKVHVENLHEDRNSYVRVESWSLYAFSAIYHYFLAVKFRPNSFFNKTKISSYTPYHTAPQFL